MRLPKLSVRLAWWLPALLAGIYVLLILVHLPAILNSVWLSSDSTIDAVLAHMAAHAPAGAVLTTGDFPHYETLAFTLLTRGLSFYRPLWMLTPVICVVVGIAALHWSSRRVFGNWPAALGTAALVCFGGGGLATFRSGGLATIFSIDSHGNSIVAAMVCGAGMVWLLPQAATMKPWKLGLGALAIGVIGGLPLAGDTLCLAWILLPMLMVTVLAAWRGPQRQIAYTLGFGLGTALVTGVCALIFAAIMRGQGVRGFAWSYHQYATFLTPSDLLANVETTIRGLTLLPSASFFGQRATGHSEMALTAALLLFTAMVAVVARVRRLAKESSQRPDDGGEPVGARFVHVTWWLTAMLAGLVIVLVGHPNDFTTDGRYVLGVYVAIPALLPLLIERGLGWKLIVTAATGVFVINAIYQFNGQVLQQMPRGFTPTTTAQALARYAEQEHVAVGYGGYWNSINLIWNSDFKVDVYPVQPCGTHSKLICTLNDINVTGWYEPRPNVRSMLILYSSGRGVKVADPRFGKPVTSTRLGDLRVLVYPYDIASRIGYESKITP